MAVTQTKADWNQGKLNCDLLGGKMGVPFSTNHAYVLHHVFDADILYIGIRRRTLSSPWLDMDDHEIIPHLDWYDGEPNSLSGQFYLASWEGLLSDLSDSDSYQALCEIKI